MLPNKLAFVDVETTGMRPTYDRIIEIGIVRVENDKVVAKFNKLLNPNQHLSPFIQQLTGITSAELQEAESFYDIKDEVAELLDDALFVAHNVRFDYGFVRSELKRHGLPFTAKQLCTVKLSRHLYPTYRKHNLTALINRHGFECERRHRAFDDAHVLWQFYQKVRNEFDEDLLKKAVTHIQAKPSFPKDLDPNIVEDLPETPGVYKFYDAEGVLLYIGKSKNIRARVLQHFNNDFASTKQMKMCQNIARIEYFDTAGELGALLRESELIKDLQPIYNRQLRRRRQLYILRKTETEDGYLSVELDTVDHIESDEIGDIVGVFRSKKQANDFLADIAKEHTLCPKLLGLEKATGACFSHRLKHCKGACVGEENTALYNARFSIASVQNQLKPWHFDNPIEITEKNPYTKLAEKFVVDKWCILQNQTSYDSDEVSLGDDYEFDLDTYKILRRYLRRKDVSFKHV